jgi:hypothetical protein
VGHQGEGVISVVSLESSQTNEAAIPRGQYHHAVAGGFSCATKIVFSRNQNDTLAPEEPNVYRQIVNSTIRAPAERNVSGDGTRHRLTFRSSGARRNLLEAACSINITSLRDQERLEKILPETRN